MLPVLLCLWLFLVPSPAAAVPPVAAPQVQPTVLEPAWSSPLGPLRDSTIEGVRLVGDLLLVEDGRHGVTALDPASGEPVWFVQLPGALDHWPVPGGALVFSAGTAQIVVDARTGARLSTRRAASIAATSPASDGRLVFVPSLLGDALVVHDIQTGLQAWQMGMSHPFSTPALLVGSDARRSVVVGTADGVLHAVPATTDVPRTERWVVSVGRPVASPVLRGDRVYVASSQMILWVLSAGGGDVQWKALPGEPLTSGPVPLDDKVFVSTPSRLLAFSVEDGAMAWERSGTFTPLGDVAGLLLVRAGEGTCQLLAPRDGALRLGGLPPDLMAAGPVAVALRDGRIVAWGTP